MDVIERLKQLTEERGWSEYKLVKMCGLPSSTISNIFHRNTIPSIPTLEIICKGFGITLSQFFSEGDMVSLSKEQEQMLRLWSYLSEEQQESLCDFLRTLN